MGKRGKDKAAERFTGKEALRLITGHMPVMMAYIGAGQKYLFANRAYEQWFDLPPGGCEGRLLEDVLGKRIYEEIRGYAQAALAGRPVNFESRVVKDGKTWHFRANYLPNIQNESVLGFCAFITDLTEVRQAEEKTRQLYLDSSTDAMILVRDDGTIHSLNSVTEELFGYSKSDLLGEAVEILIPERYRDRHIAFQKEYFANPSRRRMGRELRGLRKDGREFVAEISLSSIETSQERLAAVAIRDVTERKQAEQALRDSEEQLRLITDNVAALIMYVDSSGRYRFMNRAVEDWYGVDRSRIIGRTQEEYVQLTGLSPDSVDEAYYKNRELALSGQTVKFATKFERQDGRTEYRQITYVPHIGDDRSVKGFVGLIVDITETKKTEESLRQSERRLAKAQQLAGLGDWEWDPRTDRIDRSPEAKRIIGIQPGAEEDEPKYRAPVHPADRPRMDAALQAALSGEKPYDEEFRIVRPDGSERIIHSQAEVTRDENGVPVKVVGTMLDITTRKKAEAALRDSEEQLRLITDNVEVLICYVDAAERFRFLSRAFEDWYGISRSEVIGKGIKNYFRVAGLAFDQAYKDIRAYSKRALAGERVSFEISLKNQDGDEIYRQMTYVPHIAPDGKIKGFFDQSVDITQRKRAEEALQKSEKSLIDAQRIAHLGSWEWDIGRDKITRSAEADRILGIKPEEEQRTRGYPQFVHPEDETRVKDAIQAALDGREPYHLEHRILRADGEERIIQSESEVVHDKSGTPIRMLGTILDVTEQRRAEEEKRKLTLQIQEAQKFESLGTLAGGIAHDFHNLLAAILGNVELAQLELPSEAPSMENLRAIAHAAQRAADLTKQMLAYSGKGGFLVKTLDLSRCVSEVVRDCPESS